MKRLTQGDDEQRVSWGIVPASDEITSLRDGVVTVTTTNHCRRPPRGYGSSFFATLETELLERLTFRSRDGARLAVFGYIEGFYNARRRYSTFGYRSPDRFEEEMMKPNIQTALAVSS